MGTDCCTVSQVVRVVLQNKIEFILWRYGLTLLSVIKI